MDYNILINTLINGEPQVQVNPDGTTYTMPKPPTRAALAAARVIQGLQQQLNQLSQALQTAQRERDEMWQTLEVTQKTNQRLQDEIKSLQLPKTGQ